MADTQLLDNFRATFEGQKYLHRRSNLGDNVAQYFYEDLYTIQRTPSYVDRVDREISVLNTKNTRRGIKARRGDGSLGELIPGEKAVRDPGFYVARGPIATMEIGIEVKILMKAMIKQIDRVISDLRGQAEQFKKGNRDALCIGVVGINHAPHVTSYEGEDRSYRTDGRKNKHPFQEADEAESRLVSSASSAFEEFLILRFKATNESPFSFSWCDESSTSADYRAILSRIGGEYRSRFR